MKTMYKSPIELILGKMRTEIDNEIARTIRDVGMFVDMEELIKALAYDRQQYEKGYKDGKAEKAYGMWIEDDYGYFHCSECGYEHDSPEYITPYCPHCGANMDEEERK